MLDPFLIRTPVPPLATVAAGLCGLLSGRQARRNVLKI